MSMMKQYFDAEIAAKSQQEYQTQGPDFAGYFEQTFREDRHPDPRTDQRGAPWLTT